MTGVGTPASHIRRLAARGFDVIYRTGSLAELETWLEQDVPCILYMALAIARMAEQQLALENRVSTTENRLDQLQAGPAGEVPGRIGIS